MQKVELALLLQRHGFPLEGAHNAVEGLLDGDIVCVDTDDVDGFVDAAQRLGAVVEDE